MEQHRNGKPNESADPGTNPVTDEQAIRDQQLFETNEVPNEAPDSTQPSKERPKKPSRTGNEITEWIKALAIAGLLVFVIRWFLLSPFIVDGPSMQPNFWNRERIIVNKIIYDIRKPQRGEVIVFHVPQENRDFIKRVIGLPGDTVKVEGDTVYINGKPYEEKYLKAAYDKAHAEGALYNRSDGNFPNSDYPNGVVPAGTVFVMGDNRPNSEDSRMIGYIPMDRIVGRADLVFWPLNDFHVVTH
jgi:signal peptidase I